MRTSKRYKIVPFSLIVIVISNVIVVRKRRVKIHPKSDSTKGKLQGLVIIISAVITMCGSYWGVKVRGVPVCKPDSTLNLNWNTFHEAEVYTLIFILTSFRTHISYHRTSLISYKSVLCRIPPPP